MTDASGLSIEPISVTLDTYVTVTVANVAVCQINDLRSDKDQSSITLRGSRNDPYETALRCRASEQ